MPNDALLPPNTPLGNRSRLTFPAGTGPCIDRVPSPSARHRAGLGPGVALTPPKTASYPDGAARRHRVRGPGRAAEPVAGEHEARPDLHERAWCGKRRPRRAALPEWATPHDLRHYFASVLIRSGASVKVVQARLGHSSAKTTLDVYGHLFADEEDRTRAAIDPNSACFCTDVHQRHDLRDNRRSAAQNG